MKVDQVISVRFSEEELKEALVAQMELDLNDTIVGSPEWHRRKKLVDHVKNNHCIVDLNNLGCVLLADGVANTEDF